MVKEDVARAARDTAAINSVLMQEYYRGIDSDLIDETYQLVKRAAPPATVAAPEKARKRRHITMPGKDGGSFDCPARSAPTPDRASSRDKRSGGTR